MTVAKVWDGSAWVPIVGAQGPIGPQGPPGPSGTYLDVRRKVGAVDQPSGQFTSSQSFLYDRVGTGAQPMQISYQPSVNAWWEVTGHQSQIQKIDSAYHYGVFVMTMSPVDADGVYYGYSVITQHSAVQQYESHHITRLFKLTAGINYEVHLGFSIQGGTWTYYCGPGYSWIEGKAWAR